MKIGVITFHNYDNYGAILQSYALQKKLRELGTEPEIIDYDCAYISNPFRLVNLREKGLFNYFYGVIGHICYLPRRRRCNLFRRHIRYGPSVTRENIREKTAGYDALLAGSDQVWDYKLTNFDRTYFLDFAKEGIRKLSYAASIGEHLPPEKYRSDYASLLGDFDRILVREEYGADVVEELTGVRPETAVDPTLLLTAEEWSRLCRPPRTKKPYILVYQLGINPSLVAFVRRLQKKTGYAVKYIPFPLVGVLRCSCKVAVGPSEWIGLFRGASCVVSDSFHGIVFAMLFQRDFYAMTDGHHSNRRVAELLQETGLTHRTIGQVKDENLMDPIDYTEPARALARMRRNSLRRLRDMILHEEDAGRDMEAGSH